MTVSQNNFDPPNIPLTAAATFKVSKAKKNSIFSFKTLDFVSTLFNSAIQNSFSFTITKKFQFLLT